MVYCIGVGVRHVPILKLTPQSQYGIQFEGAKGHLFNFEVDSTESVWYSHDFVKSVAVVILKLTPQSQYGIELLLIHILPPHFEVDSTESVWYKEPSKKLVTS